MSNRGSSAENPEQYRYQKYTNPDPSNFDKKMQRNIQKHSSTTEESQNRFKGIFLKKSTIDAHFKSKNDDPEPKAQSGLSIITDKFRTFVNRPQTLIKTESKSNLPSLSKNPSQISEKNNNLPSSPTKGPFSRLNESIVSNNTPDKSRKLEIESPKLVKKISQGKSSSQTALSSKILKRRVKVVDKVQEAMNDKFISKQIDDRKNLRILLLLGLTAFILVFYFCSAYFFLLLENSFNVQENTNLYFNVSDCTVYFKDFTETIPDHPELTPAIRVDYRIPKDYNNDYKSRATREFAGNTTDSIFTFVNEFPQASCKINILIRPHAPIKSLKFNCPAKCKIIQDSTQLNITNTLEIRGLEVLANFKDISASIFDHFIYYGYLQINLLKFTSTQLSSATILMGGDIIIQSTDEFKIAGVTNTQSFCFASPYLQQDSSTSNCAISGQPSTDLNQNSTKCKAVYDLCKNSTPCNPSFSFLANSTNGTIYANLISEPGALISTPNHVKGKIFDRGIELNDEAIAVIGEYNGAIQDELRNNPILVFDIGALSVRSSLFTKFTVSAFPSYSYIKPWWLSSFSARLLKPTLITFETSLLPGFCPYYGSYNLDEHFLIQKLIAERTGGASSLTSFVVDASESVPNNNRFPTDGFYKLGTSRNPAFDKWYTIDLLDNGLFDLINNQVSSSGASMAAVIVSLIFCVLGSTFLMQLLIYLLNIMYEKVSEKAEHLEDYAMIQKYAMKKTRKIRKNKKRGKVTVEKYDLCHLLKTSPSLSHYLDYLVYIVVKQLVNSVDIFYDLLFEEVSTNTEDMEVSDPSKDLITGEELKILYEKFCFVNQYFELKLSDEANVELLKKKGFIIKEDLSNLTPVYTKLNIKKFNDFYVKSQENANRDSLDIYVSNNIELTAFEDDQIEAQTFIKLYNSFCDYNRMQPLIITPSLLKDRFDINYKEIPTQIVKRNDGPVSLEDEEVKKGKNKYKNLNKIKYFVINRSRVEDNIALKLEKYEDIPLERLKKAIVSDVKFRWWWVWDIIIVSAHTAFCVVMSVPILFIIVLIEVEYSPFAIKDPDILITANDVAHDPAELMRKIFNGFGWSLAITILLILTWVFNFIDLFIYYK